VAGSCEHSNIHFDSIRGTELFGEMKDCNLLNKDSAP
jgi:hypothetical protein